MLRFFQRTRSNKATTCCLWRTQKYASKKKLTAEMDKAYDPVQVERDWYAWWQECGFFKAETLDASKPKFSMALPPPNVTGSLHIGHALTTSLQDALCRYKKMQGFDVLWIPGTDHAGISTQVVVEKKIQREQGKTRHDLGRDDFMKQVWQWKEQYGGRIVQQLKATGAMTDWSREVFTMDEPRSQAVTEAFVRLYNDGFIYRANRLVNWCPTLTTALSDIEVEHKSISKRTYLSVPSHGNEKYEFGVLHTFYYPVEGGGKIAVSTTRLETMLGDTAVAIHPNDPRHKQYHGKFVVHPLLNRKIPIVCDDKLVNMEFGTGAVKVTPAHSFDDFECAQRNNLQVLNILNKNGTLDENVVGVEFAKYNRFSVRKIIAEKLKQLELYIDAKDHAMELPVCSRSGDIVEPLLVPQWFVKCKQLADTSLQLTQSGEIRVLPEQNQILWQRWLENIHDWCISRQLWWGHRIPAYKVTVDNQVQWIVAKTLPEAHLQVKQKYPNLQDYELVQDEDVLDTWFSSGLYPLSTLGWPNQTKELSQYYPLSVMETGSDILFFWVARMTMLCTYLYGKTPFPLIYLHAMVRDAQGRKMSKSLGNVIDPMDVISGISLENLKKQVTSNTNVSAEEAKKALKSLEKDYPQGIPQCGTDALRLTLVQYTLQGRQINMDVLRVVSNRHFCNKIWQATRYSISHFEKHKQQWKAPQELPVCSTLDNAWIMSRLGSTIQRVESSMNNYLFSEAASAVYQFFLYDFCDIYLELSKPTLYASLHEETLNVLYTCLETSFKLMHPFMPFITEELWQRITENTNTDKSIMMAKYPASQTFLTYKNAQIEAEMGQMMQVVYTIRAQMQQLQISPAYCAIVACKPAIAASLAINAVKIQTLAKIPKAHVIENEQLSNKFGNAILSMRIVNADCNVLLPVTDTEIKANIERLGKQKIALEKTRDALLKHMAIPDYDKVPKQVQEKNSDKLQETNQQLALIEQDLKKFQ